MPLCASTRWLIATMLVLAGAPFRSAARPGSEQIPLMKVAEFRLPHARTGAAVVVLGESLYVLGGGAPGAVTSVDRFDTRTTEVTSQPSRLLPRRYHSAFAHEGRIYLFGGQGYGLNEDVHENLVEIYDPASGSVDTGKHMPMPGAHLAAARVGNRLYFAGGTRKQGPVIGISNRLDIYDLDTGSWSTGPAMPTPREARGVAVGAFLIVPGGFRGVTGVADVEMFVPEENVWKSLPALGRRMSANALVFLGEHLFLFSDYDDRSAVLAYNLRTRRSLEFTIPGFKGARHSAAVVHRERIYVIGGNWHTETGDETGRIQVFKLNPDYVAP